MWVVMVQHKTSEQYLISGKWSIRSIHGFKRYGLLKTLTQNFNILSNADADANTDADAVATAIALHVPSCRRAKNVYCTDIGEYCHSFGYLRTLASSRLSISQLGTIFTNISAITLYCLQPVPILWTDCYIWLLHVLSVYRIFAYAEARRHATTNVLVDTRTFSVNLNRWKASFVKESELKHWPLPIRISNWGKLFFGHIIRVFRVNLLLFEMWTSRPISKWKYQLWNVVLQQQL